ncbi:hypothetical protein ACFPME_07760 [Rhodanobacter umsongensis]|uniref:Uncharacterized protein n=1 Tax=Rhodanobacter umsongensis TaxID=633153 RepID=A0ABW0JKN2_9GAMM
MLTRLYNWIDERAPGLKGMARKHLTEYYAPKNFNLWYYFGAATTWTTTPPMWRRWWRTWTCATPST